VAEAADERPITMQAGQINQCRQRSVTVNPQLQFLCHRSGDYQAAGASRSMKKGGNVLTGRFQAG
jgi:hypothetical protein